MRSTRSFIREDYMKEGTLASAGRMKNRESVYELIIISKKALKKSQVC